MRLILGLACLLFVTAPSPAQAGDVTLLVAPRDSPAAARAAAHADGKTVFAVPSLGKGFVQAASALSACGACVVTIKVASGPMTSRGGVGSFVFPSVTAPKATLRLLGGYDDEFQTRAPLSKPTVLAVGKPRGSPVLSFAGKKHALRELVVSGFAVDVAAGNDYDVKTNSLLKGSSSSDSVLAFGYLTVERLVISDNVFVNAANSVAAPTVRAASAQSEVHLVNNLFLNNVRPWVVIGAEGRFKLARYLVAGNTFALNWPYNPDANTSNPGALEIGNNRTAGLVEIRGNLFAYNVGGAIFPQWDGQRGPKMAIQDNAFWENGQLFSPTSPGQGAVVGKFNRSPKHMVYSPQIIEDEFSWDSAGNQVLDPRLAMPVQKLQALGQPAEKAPEAAVEPTPDENADSPEDFFGISKTAPAADEFDMTELAEEGAIKNYAPRMTLDLERLPFAKAAEAAAYGASPSRTEPR